MPGFIDAQEGRALFGSDPRNYNDIRPPYPEQLYEFLLTTGALRANTSTLEIDNRIAPLDGKGDSDGRGTSGARPRMQRAVVGARCPSSAPCGRLTGTHSKSSPSVLIV